MKTLIGCGHLCLSSSLGGIRRGGFRCGGFGVFSGRFGFSSRNMPSDSRMESNTMSLGELWMEVVEGDENRIDVYKNVRIV